MAPNLLGNTHGLFLATETKPAEPVQTIGSSKSQEEAVQIRQCSENNASKENHTHTTGSSVSKKDDELQIVWKNVVIFIIIHSLCLYSLFLLITFRIKLLTVIFTYLYLMFAGFGITAGAHRLWAHRAYKAKLPLRIFLMLAQSAAVQNNIHEWVRDHRVHHKFTDTNADPHNASRGFFFSHMGWLMCKKHRDVLVKGKTVDMSDVLADPVVRFQMKFYVPLTIIMNLIVPVVIPWYLWEEDGWQSFIISVGKYVISLHGTWLVNSAAHIWGMKPYDKTIKPTENKFVSAVAFGEGWHNYHHVFPWDYKAAELGNYNYNFTTCFLDLMAKIGWATELKTASEEMIRKRILRTGDGSWPDVDKLNNKNTKENHSAHHHHHDGEMIWGWGDKDMDRDEVKEIKRINRMKA